MCERASKHSQTPIILPRRDIPPPRVLCFEIPGSATVECFVSAKLATITKEALLRFIVGNSYAADTSY